MKLLLINLMSIWLAFWLKWNNICNFVLSHFILFHFKFQMFSKPINKLVTKKKSGCTRLLIICCFLTAIFFSDSLTYAALCMLSFSYVTSRSCRIYARDAVYVIYFRNFWIFINGIWYMGNPSSYRVIKNLYDWDISWIT